MLNFSIRPKSENIEMHAFNVPISSSVFSSKPNESKPIIDGSSIGSSLNREIITIISIKLEKLYKNEYY